MSKRKNKNNYVVIKLQREPTSSDVPSNTTPSNSTTPPSNAATNTTTDVQSDNKSTGAQKEVVFYETLLTQWIENRMVAVKTLISLSSAGLGLIVALVGYYRVLPITLSILVSCAVLFFMITIISCLGMYHYNPKYLEKVLKNEEERSVPLIICSVFANISFACAAVTVGAMAAVIIWGGIKGDSTKMGEGEKTQLSVPAIEKKVTATKTEKI